MTHGGILDHYFASMSPVILVHSDARRRAGEERERLQFSRTNNLRQRQSRATIQQWWQVWEDLWVKHATCGYWTGIGLVRACDVRP